MKESILITGGAGFIGSHLCEALIKEGNKIICLDNFNDFYSPLIKQDNISQLKLLNDFLLEEGDIRDTDLLQKIFDTHGITTVIHLAAMAGIRPSIENPALYFDVNVKGTINLLEVMRLKKVKRMIFASSSSVYGNSPDTPFSETETIEKPISPYGATKKAGELLCYDYSFLYGFDIFCLRFFTVYGPRQRPDLAIHKFYNLISQNKPVTVYGDGSSARDYTYIDDIINGIIGGYNKLRGFDIINLGNSKPISLSTMINELEHQLKIKVVRTYLPAQKGDANITWADISKAKRILGYDPKVTFSDGLRSFIKWKSL